MTLKMALFLLAGTVLMAAVMLLGNRQYRFPRWKVVLSAGLVTIVGTFGARMMACVELGSWTGFSFYGAVFLVPLGMLLAGRCLRLSGGPLLDLCALGVCIMLALMKVNCLVSGCCGGRILFLRADGTPVRFPSQIVEGAVALLLLLVLLRLLRGGKYEGRIYPCFMVIYGIVRYILNFLRDTEPVVWILPSGNIWSLLSIVIGVLWLISIQKHRNKGERS